MAFSINVQHKMESRVPILMEHLDFVKFRGSTQVSKLEKIPFSIDSSRLSTNDKGCDVFYCR